MAADGGGVGGRRRHVRRCRRSGSAVPITAALGRDTHVKNSRVVHFFFVMALFAGIPVRAQTGDVIDDFLPVATDVWWCEGFAGAVWADVDSDGTFDTQVVFTTLTGEASVFSDPPSGKKYFFSFIDSHCGGTFPFLGRGRSLVHFVDILAPGFVWNDSLTWVFKAVPALSVRTGHDLCYAYDDPRFDDPAYHPYLNVQAYRERGADPADVIAPLSGGAPGSFAFSDAAGIKELLVTTDFCENTLDDLILHPAPITPPGETGPTAPGAVLLFDTSGSMSWRHDGTSPAPAEEQRIALAKNAAAAFLDLLNEFGNGRARFGIVRFPAQPSPPGACGGQLITPMTVVDDASRDVAVGETIPALTASGNTPLLAGLGSACNLFADEDRRAVVLLSDGYHNCPSSVGVDDPAVFLAVNQAVSANATVYTIGFGRPSDVDHPLLEALASQTGGTFYDVTDASFDPATWDPATALHATYAKILADALGLEVGVDPLGIISVGQTVSREISLNEHDTRVTFYLSWKTPRRELLDLSVRASDGTRVSNSAAGVRLRHGATYSIITVGAEYLRQIGKVGPTPWIIEISSKAGAPEPYQYSVLLDSGLRMAAALDRGSLRTAEAVLLTASLTQRGKPLTGLREVQVTVTRPEEGFGNWFAKNKVSEEELKQVPEEKGDEALSPIGRKFMFLRDIRKIALPGRTPPAVVKLLDDGTNGDVKSGDGVYSARFVDFTKEGSYGFIVRATGETSAGNRFAREAQVSRYVGVSIDPASTHIEVIPQTASDPKSGLVDVVLTPKDTFGNFLGPRHSGSLRIATKWGRAIGSVVDDLNGSYRQTFELAPGLREDVKFAVAMQGKELGSASWRVPDNTASPAAWSRTVWVLLVAIVVLLIFVLTSRRKKPA